MMISASNQTNSTSVTLGPIDSTLRFFVWGDFGSNGLVAIELQMKDGSWVRYPEFIFTSQDGFDVNVFTGSVIRIVTENATSVNYKGITLPNQYTDVFKGRSGVFYTVHPKYLFQDSAATIPVQTDGDPVGFILDRSGNQYHATHPTDANRPIYRTDGTLHWLEHTASTVRLRFPAAAIKNSVDSTCYFGWQEVGTDNTIILGTNGNNGDFLFVGLNGSSSTTINGNVSYENIRLNSGGSAVDIVALPNTRDKVWDVYTNHKVIGFERINFTGATWGSSENLLLGYNATGWEAEGNFYGFFIIDKPLLDSSEKTLVEDTFLDLTGTN